MRTLQTNPWTAGRLGRRGGATVMFGRMYEDFAVDLDAFGGCRTIFSIASAGDTAMALAAAGHDVTAIDINPAQIAYVERRLAGEPAVRGQADRLLSVGRQLLRPAGWTTTRLHRLSAMADCDAQVAEWQQLTSGRSGAALRLLLAPSALRLGYQPTFAAAASALRVELPRRIGLGLAIHHNRDNPWAQLLFTGRWPETGHQTARHLNLLVGDAATHLENVPPGTYDGFTLSNVLDGAPDGYRHRLLEAVKRAAAPDAVVVLRTLGATRSPAQASAALRDRALIWGGLMICRAEELS